MNYESAPIANKYFDAVLLRMDNFGRWYEVSDEYGLGRSSVQIYEINGHMINVFHFRDSTAQDRVLVNTTENIIRKELSTK